MEDLNQEIAAEVKAWNGKSLKLGAVVRVEETDGCEKTLGRQ